MSVVEFLRARLDEDEKIAKGTLSPSERADLLKGNQPPPWFSDDMAIYTGDLDYDILVVKHTWPNESAHIIRHDPARVLRSVRARRKVVVRYEEALQFLNKATSRVQAELGSHMESAVRDVADEQRSIVYTLLAVVNDLAGEYSDHPNYDPAWARP